jgi:putative FmdB family regulatory protein
MPIYEYKCEEGAHVFEKIVPMSDGDKTQPCPEHGKECPRVEFSTPSKFVWGKEVVHWSAGLGSRGIA